MTTMTREKMTVFISSELRTQLGILAAQERKNLTQVVNDAVKTHLQIYFADYKPTNDDLDGEELCS
jgi:hypothetical protein